jgi:hypothetical protein
MKPNTKKDRGTRDICDGRAMTPKQRELLKLWMTRGRIESPEDIPAEAILADPNAIFSRSAIPNGPVWYEDRISSASNAAGARPGLRASSNGGMKLPKVRLRQQRFSVVPAVERSDWTMPR